MLTDSVEKGNENTAVRTGVPFRPIMFDSILKSFTPDIPDNLSGRPRFVHCASVLFPCYSDWFFYSLSCCSFYFTSIMVNMGALF